MARVSKVDPCLICDSVPCECSGQKQAKKAKPESKQKSAFKVQSKSSTVEAMKARVNAPEPVSAPVTEVDDLGPAVITEEDEFQDAIRTLAPILHYDELMKYRPIIGNPDRRTLSARASDWRKRRGNV